MKTTLMIVAALVAMSAGQAMAEDGRVSDSTLAQMGFANVDVMTDAEGTQIRGKYHQSYSVHAWGRGTANSNVGGGNNATETTGYNAYARNTFQNAAGNNDSNATSLAFGSGGFRFAASNASGSSIAQVW